MDDYYSICAIIGLSLFILWFFVSGSTKKSAPPAPKKRSNGLRKNTRHESTEDRIRRRLKARF